MAAAAAALLLSVLDYWNLLPHKTYTAEHFGIETLQSPLDADGDGIDDYTDILLGARQDAENHPKYDPSYFAGGYPPENRGVCTDVVWRALQNAGYDLKAKFDFLKTEQAVKLAGRVLATTNIALDDAARDRIGHMAQLTPGDVAAVTRQSRFHPLVDAVDFARRLAQEVLLKDPYARSGHRAAGFS